MNKDSLRPIVIRSLFQGQSLATIRDYALQAKSSSGLKRDNALFFRSVAFGVKELNSLHNNLILSLAKDLFGPSVVPTMNFFAFYDESLGRCPMHFDREDCFWTIDVCLNQNRPWPIFVNDLEEFHNSVVHNEDIATRVFIDKKKLEAMEQSGVAYLLEPGDALCYPGFLFPHWRNQVESGNFCELAFFHFRRA